MGDLFDEKTPEQLQTEWALERAANRAISRDEFLRRFTAHMVACSGETFDDGSSIREYAEKEAGPAYYNEFETRGESPETCAETDISYWED